MNGKLIIAILDYGVGNLFSVRHACNKVGLDGIITSSPKDIMEADGVILPGVGAFGHAMDSLRRLDLISPIKEFISSGRFFLGICLGFQLLMSESSEFGVHKGLDIIQGKVMPLKALNLNTDTKIPQVGWNRLLRKENTSWKNTVLENISEGEFFYFVHSLIVKPFDIGVESALTEYGGITFCSFVHTNNIAGCQFHPERSGKAGLRIYDNIKKIIEAGKWKN